MKKNVKNLIVVSFIIFIMSFVMNFGISDASETNRVIDEANIISESEEAELNDKIKEIQSDNFDVVILTVNSLGSISEQEYADDYYDYNGYGFDDEHSGVLFLISMGERKYHISTTGKGIKAFTDYGIGKIKDEVKPCLSDGEYYKACDKFLDMTKDFVAAYKNGKPYDTNNHYKEKANIPLREVIALAVSLVIALIIVGIMKHNMNTARPSGSAGNYIKYDSMNLTQESDTFMYSNVSKTKIESSSSSGGGSSTHTSSSGSSHGGGGGSF